MRQSHAIRQSQAITQNQAIRQNQAVSRNLGTFSSRVKRNSQARKNSQGRQLGRVLSSPRSGFTLIEMMSSLILLVVGAFSVFILLLLSVQSDLESSHYATARTFAQQELNGLRILPAESLTGAAIPNSASTVSILAQGTTETSANATALTAPPSLPGGAAKLWVVQQDNGSGTKLDLVTVQVSWSEPGRGTDMVTMDTYMAEGGINSH